MSISWNFFVKRRRINVENFVKSKNCKTYAEFCASLNLHDVTPPLEDEVSEYFIKPTPAPRPHPPQKVKPLKKMPPPVVIEPPVKVKVEEDKTPVKKRNKKTSRSVS
ncbi:MAG: hypothetical protein H8E12_10490 [Rhodobacteraceae bacterium]|nr:hypothetical protein [Paracoccaceae bacterium]